MIPFLKDQRWDEGMVAGVRATCARLDGSMANDSADSDEEDMEALIAFVVIFALLILIAIGVAKGLDVSIDAVALLTYLYYQPILALMVVLSVLLKRRPAHQL